MIDRIDPPLRAPRKHGNCVGCGKADECLISNQGLVCYDCYADVHDNKHPRKINGPFIVAPPAGAKVYVFVEEDPTTGFRFLTIGGTLYLFEKEEVARMYLEDLKKRTPGEDLSGVRPQQVPVEAAFAYAMMHQLNTVPVTTREDRPDLDRSAPML